MEQGKKGKFSLWLVLIVVFVIVLGGVGVGYYFLNTSFYKVCTKDSYNKVEFSRVLKQNYPDFVSKEYFFRNGLADNGEIYEVNRTPDDILTDHFVYLTSGWVDPRIMIVLMELMTSGLTKPEADANFPYGVQEVPEAKYRYNIEINYIGSMIAEGVRSDKYDFYTEEGYELFITDLWTEAYGRPLPLFFALNFRKTFETVFNIDPVICR